MTIDDDEELMPLQIENERDALARLAWSRELARDDAATFADDRFIEWLTEDARARARRSDRWTPEEVEAMADRLRIGALAQRVGIRLLEGERLRRSADVPGPVSGVLQLAASLHCAVNVDLDVAAGAGHELWDMECEEWVELPEDIPRGRYVALTVKGDSMLPLLHSGDVVLVRIDQRCVSDSVVVARRPDEGHVVKRVGRIERTRVELLSLNDGYAPISIPRQSDLIAGTVVARWCTHERPLLKRSA